MRFLHLLGEVKPGGDDIQRHQYADRTPPPPTGEMRYLPVMARSIACKQPASSKAEAF